MRGRGGAGARLRQLSCEELLVGSRQRRHTPPDHPPPQRVVLLDRRRRHARLERHIRRRDVCLASFLDGVCRLEVRARLGVRAARVAQVAPPSWSEDWVRVGVGSGLGLAQVAAPHQLFVLGEDERWVSPQTARCQRRRPQHRVGRHRAPTATRLAGTGLGLSRIAPAVDPGPPHCGHNARHRRRRGRGRGRGRGRARPTRRWRRRRRANLIWRSRKGAHARRDRRGITTATGPNHIGATAPRRRGAASRGRGGRLCKRREERQRVLPTHALAAAAATAAAAPAAAAAATTAAAATIAAAATTTAATAGSRQMRRCCGRWRGGGGGEGRGWRA